MAANPKQVTLIYGNQAYSVEQTAAKLTDQLLGDAPRDFAFHKFDAAEILSPGAGEGDTNLQSFVLACQSMPFLCERYVVRLDHVEKVRSPAQAVGKATQTLSSLWVFPVDWEGQSVWALEEHLPQGASRSGQRVVGDWVSDISTVVGGGVMLQLTGEEPRFLMPKGGDHHLLTLKQFLSSQLKKVRFADEEEADTDLLSSTGPVGARLHQILEKLLVNPPPDCFIILTAKVEREKDIPAKLLKLAQQHGKVEKFITYDDYSPVDFVLKEGSARGLKFEKRTAELLIHLAGNNLSHLASELDKMALLFPKDATPSEQELLGFLHDNRRFSPFFLAERLGERDLDGSLSVLDQFLVNSPHEHPILIGIMARHFRQLLQVHALRKLGANEKEMASQLKLHPFIARRVVGQAQRFSARELESILLALAGLDVELKRHTHLTGVMLKEFAMGVCLSRYPGGNPARGVARFH